MSKIEIIPLAAKKIKQRRIPRKGIDETMSSPDQIVAGYSGRKMAYLTTQIGRYWEAEHESGI